MAEFFCDHGAYASTLGNAPTWGVPQEGDGETKDAATASSIGSVLFTAVPTSGVISVCGASVSTSGVLNAASVTAAANALATNINATTAAVTAAAAYGAPQLRNLVFARGPAGGAPAGTCEIMMRVGSTKLNTAVNSNAAIASTLNNTPTLTQFSGGSGGCWGWFLNAGQVLGVSSSIGNLQYGVMAQKPMVHFAGAGPADNDIINVRTGRNLRLVIGISHWGSVTGRHDYLNFVFDDGSIWTGDSPTAKLTIDWQSYGSNIFWSNTQAFASYRCKRKGGLTVEYKATANYPMVLAGEASGGGSWGFTLEGVHFIELAGGNADVMGRMVFPIYGGRHEVSLVNCLFDFSAVPRPNLNYPFFRVNDNNHRPTANLVGNEFRWTLTGSGSTAVSVPLVDLQNNAVFSFVARGNSVVTGSSFDLPILSLAGYNPGIGSYIVCENNKGFRFSDGPVGIPTSLSHPGSVFMVFDNLAIGGAASYETRSGYSGFVPGQPTLTSISPDGTLWSWRVYWTNAVRSISAGRPFQMPSNRIQSRLATGVRTWSQELLLDAVALAQFPNTAFMEVQYVSSSGVPVCDRFPVSLQSSSAVWAGAGVAPFNTWVARKFSGVTSQAVALDSMMTFRISIEQPIVGGTTASFLVNPEPSIT